MMMSRTAAIKTKFMSRLLFPRLFRHYYFHAPRIAPMASMTAR
jgi:hypothetical protein